MIAAANGKIAHIRTPLIQYRQHPSNRVGAAKNVGKLHREFIIWMSHKFRVTGNSYLAYASVEQALLQRLDQAKFDSSKYTVDFGYKFIYLWFYSQFTGYGVGGVAVRLFLLKLIQDFQVLRSKILKIQRF